MSTTIAFGRLQRHTWHSLYTHYYKPMFGRNRSVTTATLRLWQKQLNVRLDYHSIGATETSHVTLPTNALQFLRVWSKSVTNPCGRNSFSSLSLLPLHRGESNGIRGTPYTRTSTKFGQNRSITKGALFLRPKQIFVRLDYHCTGATQTSYVAVHKLALQPAQVWSKSGSNKRNFTLHVKVFCP
jgi:hypothetical protein